MKENNTTNYKFLKDFKPELYKLAAKMEEDLLITPVSMLAYATRFLEYILYDIARSNNYSVNKDSGFVNNIYELIQQDYLEYYLGDLLIKTYVFRNTSIHNIDITQSLKDDKKTGFELNKRLFDIADVYYKNETNDYEEHIYTEPQFVEDSNEDYTNIVKMEKIFNKCIICGQPNNHTKSNFCKECDNLLNYREVLAKIIVQKGENVLLKKSDFDYGFKDNLTQDLMDKQVLKRIGNDFKILTKGLDELFTLTDEFMKIDEFLVESIQGDINPYNSRLYSCERYPYSQIKRIIDCHNIKKLIELMENGYSHENAISHVDIKKSKVNEWYEVKKSEFIDGNKDKFFIKYNELLIEEVFKSIENNEYLPEDHDKLEFWSQYFEGFSEELSDKLAKHQFELFMNLFKTNSSKEDALNQLNISDKEFDEFILIDDDYSQEYLKEVERRKRLFLACLGDLNFSESLKKSKLSIDEFNKSKNEFFKGNENEFYETYLEKFMKKYLNLRRIGKSTSEICEKLEINNSEVILWQTNELFKDFQYKYDKIRLIMLKNAVENQKSKDEFLKVLEMTDNEFSSFIKLGFDGDEKYVKFKQYFEEEYYPFAVKIFFEEFKQKRNIDQALKKSNLTKDDLKEFLYTNEELYEEFIDIKINMIVNTFIKKGKLNNNLFKKLNMSKEEYNQLKDVINNKIIEKQMSLIIHELYKGEILLPISKKVHCDIDVLFSWIFKGSIGDEKFEELATVYWDEHVDFINTLNLEIIEYDLENITRNKLVTAQMKYDFAYWMKWSLIDKETTNWTTDNIKKRLKNIDN